jgi:hypothetical protein
VFYVVLERMSERLRKGKGSQPPAPPRESGITPA